MEIIALFGDVKQQCYDKYGDDYIVTKEECVGHVQKRLRRALREYKAKNKGKKRLSSRIPIHFLLSSVYHDTSIRRRLLV